MSLWLHWRELVKTITMMRKEQKAKPNITTPRRRIRRREEDIRGNSEGELVAIYVLIDIGSPNLQKLTDDFIQTSNITQFCQLTIFDQALNTCTASSNFEVQVAKISSMEPTWNGSMKPKHVTELKICHFFAKHFYNYQMIKSLKNACKGVGTQESRRKKMCPWQIPTLTCPSLRRSIIQN